MACVELSLDPERDLWQMSYGVRDIGADQLISQVVQCSIPDLSLARTMHALLLELEASIRASRAPF
jgi:hypothetical protein